MATMKQNTTPKPIEINKWLGVNEAVGDTEIKLGESVLQENFRITKNFKPEKRPGHHEYIVADSPIRGMWYGKFNEVPVILFSHGGNLYKRDLTIESESTNIDALLGSVWDDDVLWDDSKIWDEGATPPLVVVGPLADTKTSFIWFNGVVLIRNATQYKQYNGTTLSDVAPYVPTIAIATAPTGVGTAFEQQNILTATKKQEFIANGSATIYQLAETSIDNVAPTVTVNGVAVTAFTFSFPNGTVTFTTAPVNLAKVVIQWSKASTANANLIYGHPYAIDFGVGNDTNIFIFGNSAEKNVFRYSMVGKANYFPADAFVKVGTDQFALTQLKPQYQSLLAFKNGGGTKIINPTPNPVYTTNKGVNPYDFPYQDLNEAVGNVAPNMVQLIENNPISLYGSSMWLWNSTTSIESERNANIISDRYKISLQDEDLKTAVTYDNQDEKEYWCNIGSKVYIYNYGNDTFYSYTNVTASEFMSVEGQVYFISGDKINRFDKSYLSDRESLGDTIPCILKSGFSDFGQLNYRKIMRDEWLAIYPSTRTSANIKFVTDKVYETNAPISTVNYNLLNFNDIDFRNFSFKGNINPQPNRIRAKVKKFTYLQYILENNTNNESLTVSKLLLQAQAQSLSK